jgi:hypothetical protein
MQEVEKRIPACALCGEKRRSFRTYKKIPHFAASGEDVCWDKFLGYVSISICEECQQFEFFPVYAYGDWVAYVPILITKKKYSKSSLEELDEIDCRFQTGF